ncbi:MAG: DUF3179 domain-containing protein [Acidobacteriota bacterium]|nr:MAG: DUF3179 domain-containing protein [Acidobacteriota bacterium]
MVHVRTVDGRTLDFIVSGKLWRNSLIMQDRQTGSLWSHITGEALHGAWKGTRLMMIPVMQTRWKRCVKQHPDTKLLVKDREITNSRYESYFEDPQRTGMFRTEWLRQRMPAKALVHGITRGPHAVAVADGRLSAGGFVQGEIGELPLVVARVPDGGVRAHVARSDGVTLVFENQESAIVDKQTSSRWDLARGLAIAGPEKGTRLDELVVQPAFWFAWSSFYPNTRVIDD